MKEDPYLALARGLPGGNTPTNEDADNPYLALIRQNQAAAEARLRTGVEQALASNPDIAAERQRLAQTSGLPLRVIERNIDAVRRKEQARAIDYVKMARESPVVARQLMDPTFTEVAVDDVSVLTQIEQAVAKGLRYTMGADGKGGLPQDFKIGLINRGIEGLAGAGRAVSEAAAVPFDILERVPAIGGNPFRRLAEGFAARAQEQSEIIAREAQASDGIVSGGISSGVQSIGQFAKYAPFLLAGPPGAAAALVGMAAEAGGSAYQRGREKGLPQGSALIYGAADGLIEWATEKIPLSTLFRSVGRGESILEGFLRTLPQEMVGEQVATAAQDLNEWAALNESGTFADYLRERPSAAAQTAIATFIGTGGNVVLTHAAARSMDAVAGLAWRVDQSAQFEEILQRQLQLAGQSALRARSPAQFRAAVQAMAEENPTTPQHVYVDGEVLAQLTPDALALLPESVRDQIDTAAAMGDVVGIPIADVLTLAPGTPLEALINTHGKMAPDALAPADVEAATASLNANAEQAIAQAQDQEAARASHEAVRGAIQAELDATKRFKSGATEAMSQWAAAFYTTMAARVGMTPEQFYEAHRLRIVAEPGAAGEVLNEDRRRPGQLEVEGFHYSTAARVAEGRDVIVDALNADKALPSGAPTLARWQELLAGKPDVLDALRAAGVFDGDQEENVYRSDIVKRFIDKTESPVYAQNLSTRLPSAVKATEDPLSEALVIDYGVVVADSKTLAKNAALLQAMPNTRKLKGKGAKDPARIVEEFIEHAVNNLLWLHDHMPAPMRDRARLWYDGGRKTVEAWAQRYGISEMQGAAAIAVLSPQNGWYANVSQAERIADMVFGHRDFVWDDAMTAEAERIASVDGVLDAKMQAAVGKTLGELLATPDIAARWARVYDQTHNNRAYRVLTPEGGAAGYVQTGAGTNATMMWKSYSTIAKAISVLTDGRAENVHYQLGKEHKVRNFYNNIFDPTSPLGYATIDTHAVAAALLRPLASTDIEVGQAFGSGASSSALTGLNGTYPIYLEAYRRAAEARGLQPRQMQSITWEAVRGLFEATAKRGMKVPANAIWERYKAGEIEQEQAQQEILALAGDITPPSWTAVPFDDTVGRTYEGAPQALIDARGAPTSAGVMFEVAPDPNDAALTAEWNTLSPEERLEISQRVAPRVVPRVLHELGTEGDVAVQLGGYLGATNPSLTLRLARPELALAAAKMLGFVLAQDSMMVMSETPFAGSEPVGAVTLTLPDGHGDTEITALYDTLWTLQHEGEPLVGGHTTADGQMVILNYSPLDDATLAARIDAHLGGAFPVEIHTIYSAFPSKEEYDYAGDGQAGGAPAGQPSDQTRARALRAETSAALRQELDARATLHQDTLDLDSFDLLADNASGESAASLEAQSRLADEKQRGRSRFMVDTRTGTVTPVFGVDGVDARPNATQISVQRGVGAEEWTILDQGEKVTRGAAQAALARVKGSLHQTARGTFNPGTLELVLGPDANLTTFFHETGHFFLEVLADLGSRPNAPPPLAADWAAVLNWFNVTGEQWAGMTLNQKRKYHERWAESIEQYLMEGRAPSVELQPVMRKFRVWVIDAYRSIKQFLAQRGVPVGGGDALNQRVTRNDKLAAWFGTGNTMVNEDGTPRVLYHGTTKAGARGVKAGQFRRSKTGAMGPAVYLGDSAEASAGYDDGAMLRVYARGKYLSNAQWSEYVSAHGWKGAEAAATADGWAGVYDQEFENATAVWNPENIKSVDAKQFADDGTLLGQDPNAQPGPALQLNDDIRRVMDRLLATETQIQEANTLAGLLPDADADGQAAERLGKRSIAGLKWAVKARDKVIAKLKKEGRQAEKDVRAAVTAEVEALPVVQAQAALAEAERAHELDPFSADMNTAAIADAFGFASIEAMHRAIADFGDKAEVIDRNVERRLVEEHADLIDEAAIQEAANAAVHNEARARALAAELRSQKEMLNARTDTGETNTRGARITVNALVEAAKQFASNIIGRTTIKDLKARAWQHTAAERRAAKRWEELTAAGKTEEAVKAKQDQVLNHAAAKAAVDAQDEVRSILAFFHRVTKGNDEKVVTKGRDPDLVNAARAVLLQYGIRSAASKGAADYLDKVKQHDPATYDAIKEGVDLALQNAQPFEALTLEEAQDLHEQIAAMWHLAKQSRQMEVAGDMMDIDDAAQELHARMEEIGIPVTVPGESGAITRSEERGRLLQFAGALLRRTEQWALAKDGKYGGPFLRLIFQPVKDAADRYRADRVAYRRRFAELVTAVAPTLKHGQIAAPELGRGYTFGRGHNGIGMAELLHAILHTGNASNKRKLLLGRKWATENMDGSLDTTAWDTFLARLVTEGTLTKAHYDFAQGVWDLLEETKPLAQKTHRDVFGRYFSEVTAEPVVTPFGVYRGGYVPAQADPRLVQDAELRDLIEGENASMSYAFPSTNKGFTKARVDYNKPLVLDLRTLPQHLDKVLLFAHMEPAVRSAARLIARPTVSQPLGRIDPGAISGMLRPWLNRSARQQVETPVLGDGRVSKLLSTIRNRAGMALMFANISNTIQQVTGVPGAAALVKPSHLMRAVATYIAHPKQTSTAVWDASPYMDQRAKNEVAILADTMEKILLDPTIYESAQAWTQQHAYFMQSGIDNVLSPIVWTGAYNQAIEEGMTHEDGVRFADGVVRQTQGTTLPEDVSRIETGPPYARAFTQFMGYFNMLANTNVTALQQVAHEVGLLRGAPRALYLVTMGLLVPLWIAEAIAQVFRGGPEDEDKDGYLDDWLAAVFGFGTIKGLFAAVPFVGQLANAAVNRANNNPVDDRVSLSPAVSLLEAGAGAPVSVYKAIVEDGNKRTAIRDVASLVSVATGLPTYAAARPLGYLAGVLDNRIDPAGPVDATRGLLTGSASPESRGR